MGEPRRGDRRSRARVIAAAALAIVFACAFVVVAVAVGVDGVANRGTTGAAARDFNGGRFSPAAGVLTLVALLTVGAVWLVRSAVRALRHEAYLGIVVPCGLLVVFGTVGEIVDLFGTASGTSDLVGGGILLLAATPVALLWRPLRESYRRS